MEKQQIKSRERVVNHGEVFTNEREVKAMCDLVKDETERIDSRVLEPACGDGNFLAEILKRKLNTVSKCYKKSPNDWEKFSIIALSSLYGVDIMNDNAEECRNRLFGIWDEAHKNAVINDATQGIRESAKAVINSNILCGDALTLLMEDGKTPIIFPEWSLVNGVFIKRRDFELSTILEMQNNGEQKDFFLSSDEYDEELGSYVPKPIKEYKPIEYWRIQCLI